MSQDGLLRALKELHQKNMLHLAYAYHARYAEHARVTGLYRNPRALHGAIKEKESTDEINLSRIEIYLVLPEDDTLK